MKRKIQKKFEYMGLGFPIVFLSVPMIKMRDGWTPDIDYNRLRELVFKALAAKPTRLTGSEIRFIRQYSKMTQNTFAQRLGISHAAVNKWEKRGDTISNMSWATEKDIRLFIVSKCSTTAKEFRHTYEGLETIPSNQRRKLKYDVPNELVRV